MSSKLKFTHLDTKVIVEGNYPDVETGAIIPPVYMTSTYHQEIPGKHKGFEYARSKNPTRLRLEEAYASIENAKFAISVSSGVAAGMLVLQSLDVSSRILSSYDIYGGTYRLFSTIFKNIHQFSFCDFTDINQVEIALKNNKIDAIWIETPSNPLLRIIDVAAIVKLAKQYRCKTILDNTFASPYNQQMLDMGLDLVFHSATKYLNGHSDVIAGAIMLNNKRWHQKIRYIQNTMGTTQSGMDSWLILRGLKTLHLRMERHGANALSLAKWLTSQSNLQDVIYPGLASHPQHKLAQKQMKSFGGVVSVRFKDEKKVFPFLKKLRIFHVAEGLAGVESLVGYPYTMSHGSMSEELKKQIGITKNLVRFSVGVEHIDDIRADIEQAMKKI